MSRSTMSVTPEPEVAARPGHNDTNGEPPHRTDTCNIIIFGETGAGKSSLVNLIAREHTRARVSPDATGCTTETNVYEVEIPLKFKLKVKLFDTVGLDEGPGGTVPNMQARKNLKKLIRTLMIQGGIHLVIYCVRSERVIRTLRRNYDLIRSQVKMRVPIVLVITGLEYYEPEMKVWWEKNEQIISNLGMTFAGHACVTTAMFHKNSSPKLAERRQESYRTVCELIEKYCLSHKNIVLFGQTGAGKSSLVNLMAGKNVAATSNDIPRCTPHWEEYPMTLDDKSYMVFDTAGLEAPQLKRAEYIDAVGDACRLIKRLKRQGGIDLLLFCIHASEVADTLQKNYRIFCKLLCNQNVPVVVVVTHLEHEAQAGAGTMDDWWKKNGKILRSWNIHVAGHACITAIEGNFPELYAQSRTTIHNIVKDFTEDRHKQAWIGGNNVLVSLVHKLKGRNGSLDVTVDKVTHYLTQHCGMSSDDASTLADSIKKDEAEGAA